MLSITDLAADVTCRARRLPPRHRHENCGEGRGYGRVGAYGDWNPGWVWARIGLVGCVIYEHHASLADSFPFVERHVPGPTGETVSGCLYRSRSASWQQSFPRAGRRSSVRTSAALLAGCGSVHPDLRSGTVGHNGYRTGATIGFGVAKQSGIGREGG